MDRAGIEPDMMGSSDAHRLRAVESPAPPASPATRLNRSVWPSLRPVTHSAILSRVRDWLRPQRRQRLTVISVGVGAFSFRFPGGSAHDHSHGQESHRTGSGGSRTRWGDCLVGSHGPPRRQCRHSHLSRCAADPSCTLAVTRQCSGMLPPCRLDDTTADAGLEVGPLPPTHV